MTHHWCALQWYTSDTTLYSQPLAKTDSEFLDSDSDYDEFDPKRLEDMPEGKFISDASPFYRETRAVRPPRFFIFSHRLVLGHFCSTQWWTDALNR